jgi:hypothetical protein
MPQRRIEMNGRVFDRTNTNVLLEQEMLGSSIHRSIHDLGSIVVAQQVRVIAHREHVRSLYHERAIAPGRVPGHRVKGRVRIDVALLPAVVCAGAMADVHVLSRDADEDAPLCRVFGLDDRLANAGAAEHDRPAQDDRLVSYDTVAARTDDRDGARGDPARVDRFGQSAEGGSVIRYAIPDGAEVAP